MKTTNKVIKATKLICLLWVSSYLLCTLASPRSCSPTLRMTHYTSKLQTTEQISSGCNLKHRRTLAFTHPNSRIWSQTCYSMTQKTGLTWRKSLVTPGWEVKQQLERPSSMSSCNVNKWSNFKNNKRKLQLNKLGCKANKCRAFKEVKMTTQKYLWQAS